MDLQGFYLAWGKCTQIKKKISRIGNDIDNKVQNIYFMFEPQWATTRGSPQPLTSQGGMGKK